MQNSDGNQIFEFGKHKSKSFSEIAKTDPSYVKWVLNIDRPKGQLEKFQNYLCFTPKASQPQVSRQSLTTSSNHPPISLTLTICPPSIERDVLHYGIKLEGYLDTEDWKKLSATKGLQRGATSRDWVFPAHLL